VKAWDIITSDAYDAWFQEQTEDDKIVIRSRAFLLSECGPNLGRPYADTLKGSKKLKNLKKLGHKRKNMYFEWLTFLILSKKVCSLPEEIKRERTRKNFIRI